MNTGPHNKCSPLFCNQCWSKEYNSVLKTALEISEERTAAMLDKSKNNIVNVSSDIAPFLEAVKVDLEFLRDEIKFLKAFIAIQGLLASTLITVGFLLK